MKHAASFYVLHAGKVWNTKCWKRQNSSILTTVADSQQN